LDYVGGVECVVKTYYNPPFARKAGIWLSCLIIEYRRILQRLDDFRCVSFNRKTL